MKLFRKKTNNKPKTPAEREASFVNISTKILLIITIIVAVAFSAKYIVDEVKGSDITSLKKLTEEVDTSLFLDNPITESNATTIKQKLNANNWDLLQDGIASYDKFSQTNISAEKTLTATPNELASLYNEIYVSYSDNFKTILKQASLTAIDGGYTLKLVCTMDLTKLLPTEKLNMSLPSRVYVISTSEIKNGVTTPLSTVLNNLDTTTSRQIIDSINSTNSINFAKYVPAIFTDFINSLYTKTGFSVTLAQNSISFNQKTL